VVEIIRHGLLAGSAALAGAVNSVAGGGTLISFPAAMAWGLPSTVANATNAVAMAPGSLASAWALRRELAEERKLATVLIVPAIIGGVTGAYILHHTSQRLFDTIIPWLVLGATLVILFQGLIVRRREPTPPSRRRTAFVVACQLGVGVYGGYFGAAMGIVMLAFLSLVSTTGIHGRNAVKNLLAALINGVATIYFVSVGLVDWRAAVIMTAGAVCGGVVGARLARRASARTVRAIVVVIGLALSLLLAIRAHH
jgi:uncharacterized membrane protein YfcA